MNPEASQAVHVPYPSDLTDDQWARIESLFEDKKGSKAKGQGGGAGRPYSATMRQIVNGILYQAFTGIPWRFLPRDIHPVYQTIYSYYTAWNEDETLATMYEYLNIVPPTEGKKARARMPRPGHPPRSPKRAMESTS